MRAKFGFVLLVIFANYSMLLRASEGDETRRGTFYSATTAVKFDVSIPLRDMPIKAPPDSLGSFFGSLMLDPDPPGKLSVGPQSADRSVQRTIEGAPIIPPPIFNFNVGTGSANPPDPVGDIGLNHYLRMSNSSFQIFNKASGTSAFGPAAINTLFTGFGGDCENENAGDPIVLYDQLADRWLVSQFSDGNGPAFFNCVALSQTSDPTGAYFRWAFATPVFPDYPKYGVWPNAYLISTREVDNQIIGAYAVDRTQMLAGNPAPTVIRFGVAVDEFSGDGLLPADVDGSVPPPNGAPAYFVGAMDDGGPYGAAQDALSLWEFVPDFATPANSSFNLVDTIPIAPYDTIFPCQPTNSRGCIPVPGVLTPVDILSYRQRPMHRAAYRNFGSYQSIVTNQSVEAAPAMAGIRWWEIRNLGANTVLYQDSTFAPGVTDGIHRWMASVAQDSAGNFGMGYSASSTSLFPSVRYTGRLERDQLNTMAQGEGSFVTGTASRTGTVIRWGDYTSMNVDPVDDCTFWYINKFYLAPNSTTWTLRAGSFKFPDCGNPNMGISVTPLNQRVCSPSSANFNVDAHGYDGFTSATSLSATVPPSTTFSFTPSSIAVVPGTSILSVNTTGAVPGTYVIGVTGSSTTPALSRSRSANLTIDSAAPTGPSLVSPATGAQGLSFGPLLTWSAVAQANTYIVEVATDSGFATIVFTSAPTSATSVQLPAVLIAGTNYFWRVRANNSCGDGVNSATSTFTTRFAPGTCGVGEAINTAFTDNMENGINGWTTVPTSGTTWTRSSQRPSSGSFAWLAVDVTTTSAQRLISPAILLPATTNSQTLRFSHDVTMEIDTPTSCFDGGFVEISVNDGASWQLLSPSSQLEDLYVGPLGTGERAWCGTRPYRTASFDVSAFAGQTVRFRFSALTDSSVGSVPHGWYVDDVRIEMCQVAGPNIAPTITAAATLNGNEDVALAINGYTLGDADAGGASVTLTVAASVGTLAAVSANGVTVTGSGTGSIVLTGSVANIQAFANGGALTYLRGLNLSGSATLTSTIDDLGNFGTGGALTAQTTTTVNIAAVNDGPVTVGTLPNVNTSELAALNINAATGFSDVDNASLTYSLSSVPTLPPSLIFSASAGTITGVPGASTAGSYVVTIVASDTQPLTAQQVFTLTILGPNIFANGFE